MYRPLYFILMFRGVGGTVSDANVPTCTVLLTVFCTSQPDFVNRKNLFEKLDPFISYSTSTATASVLELCKEEYRVRILQTTSDSVSVVKASSFPANANRRPPKFLALGTKL